MGRWTATVPLVLVLVLASSSARAETPQHVTGHVVSTFSRWGGAVPTEQERARWAEKQPVAKQRLWVRPGAQNSTAKAVAVVADDAGRFSLDLQPGTYCVVLSADRAPAKAGQYQELACLRAEWKRCHDVITVVAGTSEDHEIVIHTGGRPLCYHGPSPPSAVRAAPRSAPAGE